MRIPGAARVLVLSPVVIGAMVASGLPGNPVNVHRAVLADANSWVSGGAVTTVMAAPGDLTATYTAPPDRLTAQDKANGLIQSNSCPPYKGQPNANPPPVLVPGTEVLIAADGPPDDDVGGDASTDYFMGRWEFVKDNKDVKVELWCIDAGTDYFSLRIITSLNGTDTIRIPAEGMA